MDVAEALVLDTEEVLVMGGGVILLLQGKDLHGDAASLPLGVVATAGLLTIIVPDGIHLMAMVGHQQIAVLIMIHLIQMEIDVEVDVLFAAL